MKRLHITAEGQTEELFVRKMLTDLIGRLMIKLRNLLSVKTTTPTLFILFFHLCNN